MRIVIAAHDITAITFGLIEGQDLKEEKTFQTSPEGYVAALDQTLKDWSVALADIKGVVIVTAPGSFTASRVSTTIANGLGFAKNIPVIGIENPERLSLKDLGVSTLETQTSHVTPV